MAESIVVVSACRTDVKWLQAKSKQNLMPWCAEALQKDGIVLRFDPSIPAAPGDAEWNQFFTDLGQAQVIVLMLSNAYLSTPFFIERILPEIEARHHNQGLQVLPILLETLTLPEDAYLWLRAIPAIPEQGKSLEEAARDTDKMPRARAEVLRAIRNALRAGDPGAERITRQRLTTTSSLKTAPKRTFGTRPGLTQQRANAPRSATPAPAPSPAAQDAQAAPATASAAIPRRPLPPRAVPRSVTWQPGAPAVPSTANAPSLPNDASTPAAPQSRRGSSRLFSLLAKTAGVCILLVAIILGLQALWKHPWPPNKKQLAAAQALQAFVPLAVGNSWTYQWSQPEAVAGQHLVRGAVWYTLGNQSIFTRRMTQVAPPHVETYRLTAAEEGRYPTALSTTPEALARDGRYQEHKKIERYWHTASVNWRYALSLKERILRPLDTMAQRGFGAALEGLQDPTPEDVRDDLYVQIARNGKFTWGQRLPDSSRQKLNLSAIDTPVETPAGIFSNCIHVTRAIMEVQPSGASLLWTTHSLWAPGIGMVREYQVDPNGITTYQMELTGYTFADGRSVEPPAPAAPAPEALSPAAAQTEQPPTPGATREPDPDLGEFEWLDDPGETPITTAPDVARDTMPEQPVEAAVETTVDPKPANPSLKVPTDLPMDLPSTGGVRGAGAFGWVAPAPASTTPARATTTPAAATTPEPAPTAETPADPPPAAPEEEKDTIKVITIF